MATIPDVDINVIVMDFKDVKAKEMVTENSDGSYSIFINARLSSECQLKAYEHALTHINNNDFEKADVQQIEAIAHSQDTPIKKEELSDFHERILAQIRRSRKRIKRELQKIEERNAWLERIDPGFFDRMEGYNLERQRLGDF